MLAIFAATIPRWLSVSMQSRPGILKPNARQLRFVFVLRFVPGNS
jgi:hypothetical protein